MLAGWDRLDSDLYRNLAANTGNCFSTLAKYQTGVVDGLRSFTVPIGFSGI
jgi:hypothetical protein